MKSSEVFFAIDRLEGQLAVLIADDGASVEVAKTSLPKRVREGTVLRVSLSGGKPDWTSAKIDETERLRRLEDARKRLDQLGRNDPGGDIVI